MNRKFLMVLLLSALSSCALSVGASTSVSQDDIAFMKQKQKELETFKSSLPDGIAGISVLPMSQQDRIKKYTDQIHSEQVPIEQDESKIPSAVYFVSLSIPSEGLLPMLDDAHRLGIPATLRGLVDNDFRKTAAAIFELSKQNKNVGLQIDPTLYQRFNIKSVPALVVTCPGHSDIIRGTLPLIDALKKIAEIGDCSQTAKAILGDKS
jgi:conjugal transfer pilus assembly protein TrbC